MMGPLEQFKIHTLSAPWSFAGFDISFTNSSLWMLFGVVAISVFMLGGMYKPKLIPGFWQSVVEAAYEFISKMLVDNVGEEGKPYFPFLFTLFVFILAGNLLGLLPYSFTYTSHLAVTAFLALFVFVGVTLIGFIKQGSAFLSLFVPKGVPVFLLPFMVPIEIISYLSRPVSLSIRLFANMMAGHTMIKVFAGFVFSLGSLTWGFGALAPVAAGVVMMFFELLVAFLQAYVFTVLACIYLGDALSSH